jgi:hypothetical protein
MYEVSPETYIECKNKVLSYSEKQIALSREKTYPLFCFGESMTSIDHSAIHILES